MLFWCVVHNLEMIHFHNLFITHTHTSFLSWSMLHITPCILLTKIRRCQSSTPHRKRHHSIAYILPKTELPCNIQFIPSKGHQLVDVMPLTDRMNKKKLVANRRGISIWNSVSYDRQECIETRDSWTNIMIGNSGWRNDFLVLHDWIVACVTPTHAHTQHTVWGWPHHCRQMDLLSFIVSALQ